MLFYYPFMVAKKNKTIELKKPVRYMFYPNFWLYLVFRNSQKLLKRIHYGITEQWRCAKVS